MRDQFDLRRRVLRRLGASWMTVAIVAGTLAGVAASPAPAIGAPGAVTLKVVDATLDPSTPAALVGAYKWMINEDNTGRTGTRNAKPGGLCSAWTDAAHTTPNPDYPGSCNWSSIAGLETNAPVVAQGTEADLNTGTSVTLDQGRYLISVLADGFKLDGTPFSVPDDSQVVVPLQPWPMLTATIKAQVFYDDTETNGQYDPGEDGLSNFAGKIADSLGQVNTDVFGNPLCTKYAFDDQNHDGVQDPGEETTLDANLEPTVTHQGGKCLSGDINMDGVVGPADSSLYTAKGLDPTLARGELTIPNLGPNRYALSLVPPTGSSWVQTTTLEGNHDWDSWAMEGGTGYDTEFVVAGEPFPAAVFGYVPGKSASYWNDAAHKFNAGGHGTIAGVVDAMDIYIPQKGGLNLPTLGFSGAKIDHPIDKPWIVLSDLDRGDTAVSITHGNADGTFTINNVPDGTYTLTYWDEPQNYILDLVSVTIVNGETVDLGLLPLAGWFTKFSGYVFNDLNQNGKRDAGEPGVPNFGLTLRRRENALMDRGNTAVSTNQSGYYELEQAYPMTQWLVLEAYDDRYYTTGVTYQADNQPEPTTVLGQGVDVSVLPIIGLSGTLDWGVRPYDATGVNGAQNGGIVGSVSYDTTRNELDPQYAAAEDWQPGVPGITVKLWAPVPCATDPGTPCDANGDYELAPDGSYAHGGNPLNTYVSEEWDRPTDCVARDVDGNPLANPADQQVLPVDPTGKECLEAPLMGVQFGPYPTDQGTPAANFGAAVDGNYGFGDACIDGTLDWADDPSAPACKDAGGADVPFTPLDAGDYLVSIDLADKTDAFGQPIYKLTREEDINIGNGDQFVPQVPPPACVGALHRVDVLDSGTDDYPALVIPDPSGNGGGSITVPASTPTDNATFVDIDASPYEGSARPLCDQKLVSLQNGKSIVPMFNVFTDVPLPSRFFGLNNDDLTLSTDPRSLLFGEKAGIPFNPIGIYDFTNKLVRTVETDYNGIFDVLLPSTNRINCPTPSGVCANVYRFVGNDPGLPGALNLNFNPLYRTIAAEFEAIPGVTIPADTAPTQVGVSVQLPGAQAQVGLSCPVNDPDATAATRAPELYAVSRPYTRGSEIGFTVSGTGFGAIKGSGQLTLDGVNVATATWNDTTITVTANLSPSLGQGPHQLMVTASNGRRTVNGLAFHRIGGSYNPPLYEVGPRNNSNYLASKESSGRWFVPDNTLPAAADHAIQRALNAAPAGALVVVYPNKPSANPRVNPRGAYYENLVISKRVKLQGVGPGSPDGKVPGSILDGGAFGGDGPVPADWYALVDGLTWDGNQTIYDGAVISLFLPSGGGNAFPTGSYTATTAPTIDGFDIRGGDQMGFPGNLTEIGGNPTGQPGGLITQGGAIFANAYARNLQITNNVIQNNGGAYGTVRIGTPDLPAPDTDNQNDAVRIMNNRIIANAGTNLAGGIGIFAGADGYTVSGNDICGNFSAEYGGGVSQVGLSPNGSIDHNRIYYNQSYDEGGGIMIAGQLPTNPSSLSPGSGAVSIHENLIQANLANDDGGGIRFLMSATDCNSSTSRMQPCAQNVFNNMIVNNVSTHEGGGIALDDAPNVRIYNNTIMKNVTTATAATSNGQPAPAGISTGANSAALMNALQAGSPSFSNPLLFNDILYDNRAGTNVQGTVIGIGQPGDATDIHHWDIGAFDGSGLLAPTYSIIQQNTGTHPYTAGAGNSAGDPLVTDAYDTVLDFAPWRTNPNFVGAILVAADLPPKVLGDYHIFDITSSAYNTGAANKAVPAYAQPPATLSAPPTDIDGQFRPGQGAFDIGADEIPSPPPAFPTLTVLDTFDRADATTLGASWSQPASVTQNFNTLASTGTSSTLPSGWALAESGGGSNGSYAAGDGSSTTPNTYSFGTAAADRAFGGLRGTVVPTIGASFANTTGAAINALAISYTGEQWRLGALGRTDRLDFQLSTNATSLTNGTWTDYNVLDFTAPVTAGTVGALDGNAVANRTSVTATLTGLNIAVGSTFRIRWQDLDATGNDDGLGIDDFTLTPIGIGTGANQAASAGGQAIWNGATGGGPTYGSTQAVAMTLVQSAGAPAAPVDGSSLVLKASAGSPAAPGNYLRVRYDAVGNNVVVESTTNTGGSFSQLGLLTAVLATGDTLTAQANADGSVDVWQNSTYLGHTVTSAFTGTGRIGLQLPTGARVDNFAGGTLP